MGGGVGGASPSQSSSPSRPNPCSAPPITRLSRSLLMDRESREPREGSSQGCLAPLVCSPSPGWTQCTSITNSWVPGQYNLIFRIWHFHSSFLFLLVTYLEPLDPPLTQPYAPFYLGVHTSTTL